VASTRPMKKVKAALAAEICEHFELRQEARAILTPTATPLGFLEGLLARHEYASALSFVAHALPPREAVWWGCLCLRQACGPGLAPPDAAAVKAAAEWVLEPTEGRRRTAAVLAEETGVGTPAGSLATAAAWTGGSLAPPDPRLPVVPPGPYMPAKAVSGAVLLASAKAEPVRIAEVQRAFVLLGIDVAEGRAVWPEVKPRPPRKTWAR
jgi:hypothetical protein